MPVEVALGVGVRLGVGLSDPLGVGVLLAVGVGVGVPVKVGLAVGVQETLPLGVREDESVVVTVGLSVCVSLRVPLPLGVPLPLSVSLPVAVGLTVPEGDALPRHWAEELEPSSPLVEVPGGQPLQLVADVALEYQSGAQGTQARAPVVLLNLPGRQGVGRPTPEGQALPLGHDRHVNPQDRLP